MKSIRKENLSANFIETLCRKAQTRGKYITNVEKIVAVLKSFNLPQDVIVSELNRIKDYNFDLYKKTLASYKQMETMLKQPHQTLPTSTWDKFLNNPKAVPIIAKKNIDSKNKSLEYEIRTCIDMLLDCSNSDDISEVLSAIVDPNGKNYRYIILSELNRRLMKIKSTLYKENDSEEVELRALFEDDLYKIEKCIDWIYRHYEEKLEEVLDEPEVKTNSKIVLLSNLSNDKPYLIEDVSEFAEEYYRDFYILLKSLENGAPKNYKNIAFGEIRNLNQMRNFNSRLLLVKHSEYHVILGAFIKKSGEWLIRDRGTIANIYNRYLAQKQSLIATNFTAETEIEKNSQILTDTFQFLLTKGKKR